MKLYVQNEAHTIGIASLDQGDQFVPVLITGVDVLKELVGILKTFEGNEYELGYIRKGTVTVLALKPIESPSDETVVVVAPRMEVEDAPPSKHQKAKADPAQKSLVAGEG